MLRTMFKSKIHRATVTQADLHYVGSVTIDADLMDAADLLPGELVAHRRHHQRRPAGDVRHRGRARLRCHRDQRRGGPPRAPRRPGDHHQLRAGRRRRGPGAAAARGPRRRRQPDRRPGRRPRRAGAGLGPGAQPAGGQRSDRSARRRVPRCDDPTRSVHERHRDPRRPGGGPPGGGGGGRSRGPHRVLRAGRAGPRAGPGPHDRRAGARGKGHRGLTGPRALRHGRP